MLVLCCRQQQQLFPLCLTEGAVEEEVSQQRDQ